MQVAEMDLKNVVLSPLQQHMFAAVPWPSVKLMAIG